MQWTLLSLWNLLRFECCFVFCCFLPHDAMHSVDYAVAIYLSLSLSHAGILSKQLNILSNFSPPSSHTSLVFAVPNLMAIFLTGSNARGV